MFKQLTYPGLKIIQNRSLANKMEKSSHTMKLAHKEHLYFQKLRLKSALSYMHSNGVFGQTQGTLRSTIRVLLKFANFLH